MIDYREEDSVAYLNLNNPPVNIMSGELMDHMGELIKTIAENPELKAVAITASGKAFCAGADVGEHRPAQAEAMIESFGRLFRRLDALEIPLVMAVGGAALGAGFELVLMADVLLATAGAKFGQPEIRLGFFAPVGVVVLPELVGRARAMAITCSGRTYTAVEMADLGIVSQVVPDAELDDALEKTLADFRAASAYVLRLNTRSLKASRPESFSDRLDRAEKVFLEDLMTAFDPVEGITAFFEKRAPRWRNA